MKNTAYYLAQAIEKHNDDKVVTIAVLREIINDAENERDEDTTASEASQYVHKHRW